MGIGLLLNLVAAIVRLFPQPLSPMVDVDYGPYQALWRILPMLGLAGLVLIGAGVTRKSARSGTMMAVGSALYFGYEIAGLGLSLDILRSLVHGEYGGSFSFPDALSIFVQPFLTLLSFGLLLVIGLGGTRRWLAWTNVSSILLLMATLGYALYRNNGHMRYILRMHPMGWGWEMTTFLGFVVGMLFVGAALVLFLAQSSSPRGNARFERGSGS